MEDTRTICLHFHIFKNAGSTIDWTLRKNFSKNAISIDDINDPGTIIPFTTLLDFIRVNPNTKSISSHQIRYPIPDIGDINFIPILFIRDPIERVFSVYNFKKRINDKLDGTIKIKKSGFSEFVTWSLDPNYMVTNNYQVDFLSYSEKKSGISKNDLETAKIILKSCKILGVVERMNESLILAEEILKPYFKNIDLSYIKQNVSTKKDKKISANSYSEKFQIDEKLVDNLFSQNILDCDLHSFANKELDKRLEQVDDLEKKMLKFQERSKHNFFNNLRVKFLNFQINTQKKQFHGYQIR